MKTKKFQKAGETRNFLRRGGKPKFGCRYVCGPLSLLDCNVVLLTAADSLHP